jgi:LacI family transcriptional regulator
VTVIDSVQAVPAARRAGGVTIEDVAQHCGVSVSTVSKALSPPDPRYQVSSATRQRVREAAVTLGYRPNFNAKALARGRTHSIGILYSGESAILRGAFNDLLLSLTQTLRRLRYQLLFVPVTEDEADWRNVLEDHRVDGCIVSHGLSESLSASLSRNRVPTVLINFEAETPLSRVLFDDEGGARLATEHLLELGHRRITFFFAPQFQTRLRPSVALRRDGFERTMAQAGLASGAATLEGDVAAMADAIQNENDGAQRPTAVIAYSHREAVALLHELWKRGVRVPRDVSVVAFNDVYPVEQTNPPLTVVRLPLAEMGAAAAEQLVKLIESPESANDPSGLRTVLAEKLIVRGSTAPPAQA